MKKMTKKAKVKVYIDAENISYKKADSIMKTAKKQGSIISVRLYRLRNDKSTKNWSDIAKNLEMKNVWLDGPPGKNKVDKKMQKDIKRGSQQDNNVVCIVTSDKGFSDTAKELKAEGKRVVIIGEEKTPNKLRDACDEFIEI